MTETNNTIIALDIGERRVGLALASQESRLPSPITTLERGPDFLAELLNIIKQHNVSRIVCGYPRSMDGAATKQTSVVENVAKEIEQASGIVVEFQDETLTSVKAKQELEARNKPYDKPDVDALAATYILEDYLRLNSG